jgi:hypothetical protein
MLPAVIETAKRTESAAPALFGAMQYRWLVCAGSLAILSLSSFFELLVCVMRCTAAGRCAKLAPQANLRAFQSVGGGLFTPLLLPNSRIQLLPH